MFARVTTVIVIARDCVRVVFVFFVICFFFLLCFCFFFFQAEDGIRDLVRSRGLGDVYKRQALPIRSPSIFVLALDV